MDLFNRKALKEAQNQLDYANHTADIANEIIADLRSQIREMDQLIFQMANQPGWDQMRPFFQALAEAMMVRKKQESDRINKLVIKELNKA